MNINRSLWTAIDETLIRKIKHKGVTVDPYNGHRIVSYEERKSDLLVSLKKDSNRMMLYNTFESSSHQQQHP
ncbi:hypothetical protein Glove_319g172 [Diversispora epigaea]|uniref:Uncharacterized protein n=1 Tax=Diversispora epigaea TaxID=1348612 RepID=A0A397HPI2_9GLOM|nr:hypothetical protein Glove_319g172 [Diversispora epigaea]